MPVHSFEFSSSGPRIVNPEVLQITGPCIQVEVHTPLPLQIAFQSSGIPIPLPISGEALIDTGAAFSAVDQSVVKALSLQPIGQIEVGGVAGPSMRSQYPCHFFFPGTSLPAVSFGWLLDCNLSGLKGGQMPLVALIGRDLLRNMVLIYNGPNGSVSIAT